ncbi:MAG: PolC-type DNA polymerase III [Catonella sp.]|uniref:PolC-type DNA polymerase III n=1 Tax=Catonella sp. TaxID=2382125 RepID=UPI003F9FEB14
MDFHEAFSSLVISEELEKAFEDVSVEKIAVSRSRSEITVIISGRSPIHRDHIVAMQNLLSGQIFTSSEQTVLIEERYDFSDFTVKRIFEKNSKSILEEISEHGKIYRNIIKNSKIDCNDTTIYIENEDNFIIREKLKHISDWLQFIFEKRYNKEVEIKLFFKETANQKKEEKDTYTIAEILADRPEPEVITKPANDKKQNIQKKSIKSSVSNMGYKKKTLEQDPSVIYGKNFEGASTWLKDITEPQKNIIVRAQIVSLEEKEFNNGKVVLSLSLTDFTDSIICKIWTDKEKKDELKNKFKAGKFIKISADAQFDTYANELTLGYIQGIKEIENFRTERIDNSEKKRVELHLHTQMSEMDAVIDTKELLETLLKWGHKAVAVTDHGVVQGFTNIFHAKSSLKMKDFKIIYGVEGYLVDDTSPAVRMEKGQKLTDPAVVFDIETTGFGPKNCRIIEIGAVKVAEGQVIDKFSAFVNPKQYIPEEITKLTGITQDMVINEPEIDEILPDFIKFCEGCFLVAHNASFDTSFIFENMRRLGIKGEFTVADTVTMARVLLPGLKNYRLDTVAENLGVLLEHHHRAVDDAGCTAEIYIKLCELAHIKYGDYKLCNLNENKGFDADIIKKMGTYHIIILAKNDLGRINLYKLISKSHLTYFMRRPRIPKSLLMEHREGLIIGSACEAGELYQAVLNRHGDDEIETLANFYDYFEIQPLANNEFMIENDKIADVISKDDLREINCKIVELGEKFNKPVVATCDAHFLNPGDEIYRKYLLWSKGMKDADRPLPLYLRTTEEMLDEFSYLGKDKAEEVVITNTNLIADMIENISPVRPDKSAPIIENSDEELRRICYSKAYEIYGKELPKKVVDRLEHELHSIISNGFAVMYIIAQKLVWKSNEDGYLVGSRGSVGSSFVAFLSGITEVNSLSAHYYCEHCHFVDFDSDEVKKFSGMSGCDMPDRICPVCGKPLAKDGHDIPFETFLGFNGDKEPDIDLNFSGEYQPKAHAYTEVIFGEGQTYRAGTIGGVAEKTAFGYVLKYNEEHDNIKMRKAEIERVSAGCIGVRRTTGQHPGGIVVLPLGEDINTFTPVQHPANKMDTPIITTHFDYHSIDHNLLKLDILGHDDPTMIRMLEDLTGVVAKEIRFDDEKVLALFNSLESLELKAEDLEGYDLGSLGLPELGTDFVMQMLRDTKPKCFSDLVRISGLSHGTDVWTGNTQTLIAENKCELSTAICTRDDIMIYLINMGLEPSHAFKIMESVRKGKGLTPEWEKEMLEHNVPDWYIWSCKKIKYMFPKAHAVAYIMMALRIAYFKVYYPLAYYSAYFSIRAKAFDYGLFCLGREKVLNIIKSIKKIEKFKRKPADEDVLGDAYIVLEMYARGYSFMPIDLYRAKPKHFQIIDGKIMPALITIDGMGDKAAYALHEAAKKGEFLSKDDLKRRAKGTTQTAIDTMTELGILDGLPNSSQISLFDIMIQ